MTGQTGWDTLYPSQQAALADIQCYLDAITASEGSRWWKRDKALLVAGDASEYAFAAYTPNGEFHHPIVITFTPQELELVAQNNYSSTLRKILCISWVLKVVLQSAPSRIHESLISTAGFSMRRTAKQAFTVSWA